MRFYRENKGCGVLLQKMTKLSDILKRHPEFRNYLDEKKREAFMEDDDGFISDLEDWKSSTWLTLQNVKDDLNEILNSDLMKQACKFAPWVKERWLGQLALIHELLGEIDEK